ncbi:MAG: hypothetical protein F6K19_45465 [Cyanothece sp. SIO1E1]|nr:hypothetical protein [Cyanothece sp. SIO1E1]
MSRDIARELIAGYGGKSTEVDWVGSWGGLGLAMLGAMVLRTIAIDSEVTFKLTISNRLVF